MKYKRGESFRFQFNEGLECLIKIISIDGSPIDSKLAEGLILDISPTGLKLSSSLDFPTNKPVVFFVEFALNDQQIKVSADLVWKKNVGNGYHYGLKQHGTKEDTRLLIDELKKYVKKHGNSS